MTNIIGTGTGLVVTFHRAGEEIDSHTAPTGERALSPAWTICATATGAPSAEAAETDGPGIL